MRYLRALVLLVFPFISLPAAATKPTDLAAASYYVPRLPGLPDDPITRLHIYAGEILSDPKAAVSNAAPDPKAVDPHIYFVLVRARKSADKERIIFWFNGGPGCSSFDGLMMEVGPWRVDNKGGLKYVDGGWEEYTNIVYVDQPPGTGFSYTSSDKMLSELTESSAHVVQFMRTFYDIFPEFKPVDTYLAGESYAGQYIPYIADAILGSNLGTKLKGIAIGNGWIDPLPQYKGYIDYAVAKGLVKSGSATHNKALEIYSQCVEKINSMKVLPAGLGECEYLMNMLTEGLQRTIDGKHVCLNVYDIRLVDDYPACGMNWPPDLKDIYTYLRRKDVVNALHASEKPEAWTECSNHVYSHMRNHNTPASITILPALLDKIDVLLFSGDQDFICNYIGHEALIENMTWGGAKGFGSAKARNWVVNGQPAGLWTEARRLTYARVYNASHMVPYDVPHVSHDMMLRFMGVDFAAIASGSVNIPSNVGNMSKPVAMPGTGATQTPPAATQSPEEQKAMWDAYYNAGSIALVVLLIGLGLGLFFFCRNQRRRRASGHSALSQIDDEEAIPLTQNDTLREKGESDEEWRARKGKGRAEDEPAIDKVVFDAGDSDDDDNMTSGRR